MVDLLLDYNFLTWLSNFKLHSMSVLINAGKTRDDVDLSFCVIASNTATYYSSRLSLFMNKIIKIFENVSYLLR